MTQMRSRGVNGMRRGKTRPDHLARQILPEKICTRIIDTESGLVLD